MTDITVVRKKDGVFHVTVDEDGTQTKHSVTLHPDDYERITTGRIRDHELVEKSFLFLLARETKEQILEHFDLMDISRYFPEYEQEIQKRIS